MDNFAVPKVRGSGDSLGAEVLFNAVGVGMVTYYRSLLPSIVLGQDLLIQNPGSSPHQFLNLSSVPYSENKKYDVVIVQMPMNPWQPDQIRKLKETNDCKVLVNIDDWIKDLPNMKDSHELAHAFKEDVQVKALAESVEEADGLITSTPWLRDKYDDGKPVFVCPNGLDLARYNGKAIRRPPRLRNKIVLGWAGAVGHLKSFGAIAEVLTEIMHENSDVALVTIGMPVFKSMKNRKKLRPRMAHYNWMDHWLYPQHTMMFDVGLAPAEDTDFFRAKSQLRLYEYGAVGLPVIGHPTTYSEIKHGETGFKARTPDEYYTYIKRIVEDHDLRVSMGARMHEYVWTNCGIQHREDDWRRAISGILADGDGS